MHRHTIIFFLSIVFLWSCKRSENKTEATSEIAGTTSQALSVETSLIEEQAFLQQIIANGLVKAVQKTELRFKSGNRINKIFVENGQQVSKGSTLAVLDNEILENQLQKAKIDFATTEQELQKIRINYGYGKIGSQEVDSDKLEILRLKSGYLAAENTVQNMQILYDQTSIEAPFSGVVANIRTKPGDYITSGEVFCTLIDQNNFEVHFSILESELPFVQKGQTVKVVPYAKSNKEITAHISEINPLVSENGLIELKAKMEGVESSILDGMHVKVFVNKPIAGVIVVPKEAVVLRSDREVVFTVENGLAKWNYVEVLYENASSYALKKGLKIGDTIIVSGNMNLAHDAKVNTVFQPGKAKTDG